MYVTRYYLESGGPVQAAAQVSPMYNGEGFRAAVPGKYQYLAMGRDAFFTLEEANADVGKRIGQAIRSAKKKLAAMELLQAKYPDPSPPPAERVTRKERKK